MEEIKILQQNHGDVSEARNRGIKASAGAFIAFIDQDDTWAPEKIAKQAGLMQSSDADLVFTPAVEVRSGPLAGCPACPACTCPVGRMGSQLAD